MSQMLTSNPGAPRVPEGNPMLSNMGPAAYADRADVPDLTLTGLARIVPLRVAPDFHLDAKGPDPRGMTVVGADKAVAGTIVDVWVDRSEPSPRFFEVALASGSHTVLLPSTCARINARSGEVRVKSITAAQFAQVPRCATADRVTLREEDRIMAYYASGYLYALPERQEPLF